MKKLTTQQQGTMEIVRMILDPQRFDVDQYDDGPDGDGNVRPCLRVYDNNHDETYEYFLESTGVNRARKVINDLLRDERERGIRQDAGDVRSAIRKALDL